jgi:hypothetical protein
MNKFESVGARASARLEYVFFCRREGHRAAPSAVLTDLRSRVFLKELGSHRATT